MDNNTKEEILDYISKNLSSLQFKTLRENEVEATDDEKLSVMSQTLENDPALFLTKWGKFLPKNELEKFECDYEVNWHLNKLLSTQNKNTVSSSIASEPPIVSRQLLPNSRHNKQILNRRFKYLTTKLDNTSYFGDEAMEMREPSLYEDYVGQYIPEEERYKEFDKDVDLIDRVYYDLDQSYIHDRLQEEKRILEEQEVEEEEEEEEENGGDIEEKEKVESDIASDIKDVPQISEEEKEQLRADLVDIMRSKFMSGDDPDFDYDAVDFNEEYDDVNVQEQEIQEKYFDNEEPTETSEVKNGTGEYDY
ncbi:coiled-coil domain-containing protein [Glomus cerebriforme]|uniref:Coiled-coil domain-containing protein n=1 Tax=Glomus cerebriforme TaxID=658196 RepID=A0A397SYD7_9GLOM|nr:coiled-coil domain-containing protein [Glomus cerebriforme]